MMESIWFIRPNVPSWVTQELDTFVYSHRSRIIRLLFYNVIRLCLTWWPQLDVMRCMTQWPRHAGFDYAMCCDVWAQHAGFDHANMLRRMSTQWRITPALAMNNVQRHTANEKNTSLVQNHGFSSSCCPNDSLPSYGSLRCTWRASPLRWSNACGAIAYRSIRWRLPYFHAQDLRGRW